MYSLNFSFNLHNYSYSDPSLIESAPVSQVVFEVTSQLADGPTRRRQLADV